MNYSHNMYLLIWISLFSRYRHSLVVTIKENFLACPVVSKGVKCYCDIKKSFHTIFLFLLVTSGLVSICHTNTHSILQLLS